MNHEHDRKMLLELLTDYAGQISDGQREAFRDMFSELKRTERPLSFKQREWVSGVHERFVPKYENLVSNGKVPRGREVELLVRDRPLRPPMRRSGT
jgi:hypothetical protein